MVSLLCCGASAGGIFVPYLFSEHQEAKPRVCIIVDFHFNVKVLNTSSKVYLIFAGLNVRRTLDKSIKMLTIAQSKWRQVQQPLESRVHPLRKLLRACLNS